MVWVCGFDLREWVLGCGSAVVVWGRDRGWVLILHKAVLMETMPVEVERSASDGVLNGFFFEFLWISLHGGGGCVVAVVVSLVVVAKVGFNCVDFCFDFLCGFPCMVVVVGWVVAVVVYLMGFFMVVVVVGFLWQRWWWWWWVVEREIVRKT